MGTFGEKERDLLIEVATNVKNICKKQDDMNTKLNTHVTKKIWMWVTGGLAATFMVLVIGAYTYTYNVNGRIINHITNFIIHNNK